ncbi:TIGR02270 family protein [Archangium violaceum]|uniref:TIGR02270 family protein n=1 Tax=Archangium violaceum TaxID=83451 RepID=UPI0036DC461B
MHINRTEPLWDIVEFHIDEAEFLWAMWERSLDAPNYTLDEVAEGMESRLLAHIDGLVVNGAKVAEQVLHPIIFDVDAEPTRISAATLALLNGPGSAGFQFVFTNLTKPGLQHAAIVRALEVCDRPDIKERLQAMLTSKQPEAVVATARAMVFKRISLGQTLPLLLAHPDPDIQALGLSAILLEPHPTIYSRDILRALASTNSTVRDAALVAGIALGIPEAWAHCREFALGKGPAMLMLALAGNSRDHDRLLTALDHKDLQADALWALGFSGTPTAADACLAHMDGKNNKRLSRLAGEAFCTITGLDLEAENLSIETDERDSENASEPDTGDEREDLMLYAEDDLPLPDAEGVQQWWARQKKHFNPNTRYLRGAPLESTGLLSALRGTVMRRRHVLALHLTLWTQGMHTVTTRALSQQQLSQCRQLEELRSQRLEIASSPFRTR